MTNFAQAVKVDAQKTCKSQCKSLTMQVTTAESTKFLSNMKNSDINQTKRV